MITVNGETYEVIDNNEFEQKENETDMEFAIRHSKILDSATHFLSKEVSPEEGLERDKIYRFFRDIDGEYVIEIKENENSLIWMFTDGEFLIQK